jgi:hypothetical protein
MIITNILGVFLFLFVFWKKLKEDYSSEIVFNLAFISIFGLLCGIAVSYFFYPEYWFWYGLLGTSVSFSLFVRKYKLRFFECYETLLLSLLAWLSIYYLFETIVQKSLTLFINFWISIFTIFIYFFLSYFYKSFTWYKSGRLGLSGVVTVIVFFIIRFIAMKDYFSLAVVFVNFLLLLSLFKKK